MTDILNPFPYFPEAGTGGYIYVGSAGSDARTTPITVYRDEALTVPWAQPIRTINGYPAYQGAQARIYASPNTFSLTVLDKNSRVVTNGISFADTLRTDLASTASGKGAALVGNTGDGTGAIGRTVRATLNEMPFSITGFGAVSGSGDKSGIIQAALNAAGASTNSREVVIRGNGSIELSTPLVMPSGVRLINEGNATFLPLVTDMFCFSNAGAFPTSYNALTADAVAGTAQVSIASTAAYTIGDLVFIRSQALLPDTSLVLVGATNQGFNTDLEKIGQLFRVEAKTSTILYLDGALEYNYLTSDTAEIGIATGYTDLSFDNLKWGSPSHATIGGRAINLKFAQGFRVNGLEVWNRPVGAADNANRNGVLMEHVVNGLVEYVDICSGYYGVSTAGASRAVTVRHGIFNRNRHAISTSWQTGYGEPIDQLFEDLVCQTATLSSFDTHPVGRRITFRKCSSIGAGDDGFQVRAVDVTIDDCSAKCAYFDGLGHELRAVRLNVSKFKSVENYRMGVFSKEPSINLNNCEIRRNGQLRSGVPVSGRSGMNLCGGNVTGGILEDNDLYAFTLSVQLGPVAPAQDFVFRDFDAPYSARQTSFCYASSASNTDLDLGRVTLSGVRMTGYSTTNANYFFNIAATIPNSPFRENTVLDASALREGRATLVAGTVTISTAAFRAYAGGVSALAKPTFDSTVVLQHVTNGGTPGALRVSGGVNATSFEIVSSSATDTSLVHWKIVD